MATFIKCKFQPAERNPDMVNLDLVQRIRTLPSWGTIEFYFTDNERIAWTFESVELKEKEYDRILKILNC